MRRMLIVLIVLTFFGCATTHFGTDDDLKATHKKMCEALSRSDAITLGTFVYYKAVAYLDDSASPIVLPPPLVSQTGPIVPVLDAPIANAQLTLQTLPTTTAQGYVINSSREFFKNIQSYVVTPYDIKCIIYGDNNGIVFGYLKISKKQKGQPMITTFVRHTSTWLKTDGKWRWISSHNSAMPSGN